MAEDYLFLIEQGLTHIAAVGTIKEKYDSEASHRLIDSALQMAYNPNSFHEHLKELEQLS